MSALNSLLKQTPGSPEIKKSIVIPTQGANGFKNLIELAKEASYSEGYSKGWEEGVSHGSEKSLYILYSCICTTLNRMYGFGAKRCFDVLTELHEEILFTLDHMEKAEEVYEKMGLTIDFTDTNEPFKKVEQI